MVTLPNRSDVRVSYCTTCHGRLWQIALTLFDNLQRLRDDEELVLVDYGSADGLSRFISASPLCQSAMESGRLIYARTEAKHYHCPKAKNLAHRLGRGDLLVNLDADNSNGGMRRAISRRFARSEDIVLQMDEGTAGDPLRGTFGRICIPRYWFYRLGGYDESFAPIGHQDQDLIWRAKAIGLRHVRSATGGPAPIRNTMVEKASNTGRHSWHAMWRANEKTSRRNLKEGRLIANLSGWGAAEVAINFNETQTLVWTAPQLISIVLVNRHPSLSLIMSLLERYSAMRLVGEILLVNQNQSFAIVPPEKAGSNVRVMNAVDESQPFARLAAAALALYPAVLLTSDDFFLPEESLTRLHKAWFADPFRLHAAEGPGRRTASVDLSVGTLATIATCVKALTNGSRLCAELTPKLPPAAEDILLSFAAGPRSGSEQAILQHHLPVVELAAPDNHRQTVRRARGSDALAQVFRWCERSIAQAEELVIEGGPVPPTTVTHRPFFATSSKDSVLFAGPWVGEFGWELCWWNPMVRFLAKTFQHIIVAAPGSSRYLYEFATEFIPLKTEGWRFAEGRLLTKVPRVCNGSRNLDPFSLWEELGLQECDALRTGETTLTPKTWRSLAPQVVGPLVADVMCAFRPEKKIDGRVVSGKDYPVEQCQELVRMLISAGLSIACYGGLDNYWFEGTIDYRGQPLELQCAALSSAKCAVGPSSAPMHLASLCKCPHVTWSRISPDVAVRYATLWNPFATPASFMVSPAPAPREVAEEVLRRIEETTSGLQRESRAV